MKCLSLISISLFLFERDINVTNNLLLESIQKTKKPQSSDRQDFLTLVENIKPEVADNGSFIEKALIAKLKAGNTSSFTGLFIAYYNDIVLFAFRFVKDIDSSEEIVQDSFVKLWEERESMNITVSVKAYLLKTVRNKCIDFLRHKKIQQKHNDIVLKAPTQVEYDTDHYLLYSELEEQIEAVLKKLPQEVSDTFRMNRYKGLKYHEIAQLLNVSVRTIEVRIGKALHQLRYHLKEYFPVIIMISLSAFF